MQIRKITDFIDERFEQLSVEDKRGVRRLTDGPAQLQMQVGQLLVDGNLRQRYVGA